MRTLFTTIICIGIATVLVWALARANSRKRNHAARMWELRFPTLENDCEDAFLTKWRVRSRRYLLRDRDAVYGDTFRRRVESMGIAEILTAARSPWQNPYAERMIGTIRRYPFDHVIVLGEGHLRRQAAPLPSLLPQGANSPFTGEGRGR